MLKRLLVPTTPCLMGLVAMAAICLAPHAGRLLSFDTFLHTLIGEHMWLSGEMVDKDPSIWPIDTHYLDHEWLPQLIMAAFELAWGLEGLVLFTGLMIGATYWRLAVWMRRREISPLVIGALFVFAFSSLGAFHQARPFLFTWLLAVIWADLLDRLMHREITPRRWALISVVLMFVWVNLHAGFLLGFFLLGIYGLGQLWNIGAAAKSERPEAIRLFLWMFGTGQLALFVSALNPWGFRLHAHFIVYMMNTRLITRINEWQSPYFHSSSLATALIFLGVLLLITLASPKRPTAPEVVLVVLLFLSALKAQRNLPLFFLLTLPVFGQQLENILARGRALQGWLGGIITRATSVSRFLAAGEMRRGGIVPVALALLALVTWVGERKIRPAEPSEPKFPVEAARFISERPELFAGRMFNRYDWGGYLAWALAPKKVFINGLQDHFGEAHYADYVKISALLPDWQETLDKYEIDWIIAPTLGALNAALDLHPEWQGVYADQLAAVYVKRAVDEPDPVPAWARRSVGSLPNVVVLVLDTLRADALSVVSGGDVTPALDRLAAEGALFTNARTTSAWTLPSHGSLFTGLYPSRHGAHWENRFLASPQATLAEALAPTHQTGGFSENPHITAAQGFAQGFEHYEETWREGSEPTLDRTESWLDTRLADTPFFLFVNLMTPHLPYRPTMAAQERFLPADTTAEEIARLRAFNEREARQFIMGELELPDRDLQILRALYRADVADADAQVQRLLGRLEADGELDRTLFIVVGDHGENIGDHGLMEHQLSLHETLLRVPMILRLPGIIDAGRVDDSPVQLVDILPTVLDAIGVPLARRPATQGTSLLHTGPPSDRPVIAEYMRPDEQKKLFAEVSPAFDFTPFDRRLKSIQVGSMKLLLSDRSAPELYDLESDPGETRNLASERPHVVAALTRRLEELSLSWPASESERAQPLLDEETRKALRSLGYL